MTKIGIIGAGAWGTALAALAAVAHSAGSEVIIQAHEPEVVDAINNEHENSVFLPGFILDSTIRATNDAAEAAQADAVLLVTPAQHLRAVTNTLKDSWQAGVPAVICAKGMEQDTSALMSEVLSKTLPGVTPAVLSGPTFAIEVAKGLPTAVTLACADQAIATMLTESLGTPTFRTYRSTDVIGAQLGGAVKNVLAIACGIVDGKGLGENARAALITRGLAEIARLGVAKGAQAETLMAKVGVKKKAVVHVLPCIVTNVRLRLGQIVEYEQTAFVKHAVGFLQRLFLIVDVIDSCLTPHMSKRVIVEGQIGG